MIDMYNNVQPQIADASVFTPNIWPIVSPISQSKAWVCVCDMLAKGENEIKRVVRVPLPGILSLFVYVCKKRTNSPIFQGWLKPRSRWVVEFAHDNGFFGDSECHEPRAWVA